MSTEDLDQIARLFRLRESGALTQAEFEAEKARVLGATGKDRATAEGPRPPESVEAATYAEAAQLHADPPEAGRFRTSRGPLALAALAAILAVAAGAGWYSRHNDPTTEERGATANAYAPAAKPLAADAPVMPFTPAKQDDASLYRWATSTEPLGVTPEFLIQKLGAPRRRDSSSLDFVVSGCDIQYEAQGSAISSFDAEVTASCKPSLAGLNSASAVNLAHATSLGQVEQKAGGLLIADCLEMCGNAADPAQYLFIEGPHADNFINVAVMADSKVSGGTEKWAAAIRAVHNLPSDAELPAESYECGREAQEVALGEVGPVRIGRVLVGQSVTKEKLTNCGVDTN